MAEYNWKIVVEITITAGMNITAWRDTLDDRVIETAWYNTWRPLLWRARQQVYAVHV